MSNRSYDKNHLKKYPIQLHKIPKLFYNDPKVDEYITSNEPVVLQGSGLVASTNSWDIEYLERNMTGKYTVIVSKNHNFKYHDEKKMQSSNVDFQPMTKRIQMKLGEFVDKMNNWKKGDDRLYFQQVLDNSVGENIMHDFSRFNWHWLSEKQIKYNWGPLTSNLLLISIEGNVTPCHYDEQQNFFAQIKGFKRIILFRPSQFECLYPHPVHHPYDRQSQVDSILYDNKNIPEIKIDFEKPDYDKFPNFKNAVGFETVIEPGEVLYIPMYWFHHIESLLRGGYTISINFWHKAAPINQIVYPLKDHQKVAIMRNVEKMLGDALRDTSEVGPLLRTIIAGRYED